MVRRPIVHGGVVSTTVRGTLAFNRIHNRPNGVLWIELEERPHVEVQIDDPCGLSVDNQECTVRDFLAWYSVHHGERIGVLLHEFLEDLSHNTGAASARRAGFFSE